jgi:hypothetical protein
MNMENSFSFRGSPFAGFPRTLPPITAGNNSDETPLRVIDTPPDSKFINDNTYESYDRMANRNSGGGGR